MLHVYCRGLAQNRPVIGNYRLYLCPAEAACSLDFWFLFRGPETREFTVLVADAD